jgi:hypothetical protein
LECDFQLISLLRAEKLFLLLWCKKICVLRFLKITLMKKTLRSFLFIFGAMVTFSASAQLPDGSIAPDFTVTDLEGNDYNLYDILDEGKQVILDFSATWCGPCWGYHQAGTLETIWEEYGPEGTDEVMVFYIEADPATTIEDLNGTGGNTQGDWVTGTGYPVVDDAAAGDLYAVGYYPTIYTVCPNRIITETGQASVANHVAFFQNASCQAATLPADPAIISYNGSLATCADVDIEITMMNLGTEVLTSATIEVFNAGVSVLSYDWMGSIDTYATEDIMVGTLDTGGSAELSIEITSPNDNTANDAVAVSIAGASEATTHLRINLLTDNYPAETGWSVIDENGIVVASASAGDYAALNTFVVEDVFVPSTGCYSFTITDTYGDGLFAEQWSGTNGSCEVLSMNEDGTILSTIYDYDGSYDFEAESAVASVTTVVGVEESEIFTSLSLYPNPAADFANLVFGVTESSKVSVDVFNVLGAQVMSTDLGTIPAGEQRIELNFSELEAGMYIVNVTANNNVSTLRVTLAK